MKICIIMCLAKYFHRIIRKCKLNLYNLNFINYYYINNKPCDVQPDLETSFQLY